MTPDGTPGGAAHTPSISTPSACHDEHLLAYSCRTRNLCASCREKWSVVFAERLRTEIVARVANRHVVSTIPIALRGLFERERPIAWCHSGFSVYLASPVDALDLDGLERLTQADETHENWCSRGTQTGARSGRPSQPHGCSTHGHGAPR